MRVTGHEETTSKIIKKTNITTCFTCGKDAVPGIEFEAYHDWASVCTDCLKRAVALLQDGS